MTRSRIVLSIGLCAAALTTPASAVLITFTGGTVTRLDATTETTSNTVSWNNVDYYEEGGFRLDFFPNTGSVGFATHVGNYYGVGNDVIHAHWATGNFGGVTSIEITKVGGGTFDINYFTLTSNTDLGGGPASGNELAWVQGYLGGLPVTGALLLPPENWGFPGTVVGLGPAFDNVDKVVFFVSNTVDCFGMDNFYIDEIPEPATLSLCALAGGLVLRARRRAGRN